MRIKGSISCNRLITKQLVFYIVEPEPIGCSSDSECASNQACRDRSCINPCTNDKPCSSSAICSVRSHKATCKCPPGFEGDPYRQCRKSKTCLMDTELLFCRNIDSN